MKKRQELRNTIKCKFKMTLVRYQHDYKDRARCYQIYILKKSCLNGFCTFSCHNLMNGSWKVSCLSLWRVICGRGSPLCYVSLIYIRSSAVSASRSLLRWLLSTSFLVGFNSPSWIADVISSSYMICLLYCTIIRFFNRFVLLLGRMTCVFLGL